MQGGEIDDADGSFHGDEGEAEYVLRTAVESGSASM